MQQLVNSDIYQTAWYADTMPVRFGIEERSINDLLIEEIIVIKQNNIICNMFSIICDNKYLFSLNDMIIWLVIWKQYL